MGKKRREVWAMDCETDPFKPGRVPKPFIWGIYTGKEYYEFTETEKAIAFLVDQPVIVYAHNGGKFDWHFVLEYISDFESITVINGRLAKFKIGECEFRDSYNIIPAPLSAYKKDDFDYNLLEVVNRNKPKNKEKISAYLKNDCIYLHEMITAFIDRYGIVLTQAGAAMKVWSEISGIKKPKSDNGYYARILPYYYGGRVECFKTGIIEEDFTVIDINSAYPDAMMKNHPFGLSYSTYTGLPDHLDKEEISRSFLHINGQSFGAFPYRTKDGLKFPNDNERRDYYVTGWEYLTALETGTIGDYKIIETKSYLETVNFKDYVTYFYNEKLQAEKANDKVGRLFAKLFLNSLYGKFASNPENYQEFMTIPADLIDGACQDGWNFCKIISENTAIVNKPLEEEKHRYYDIAVSASITGYVRAHLWRVIKQCENVFYCDTDSIAAQNIGSAPISKNLGDWNIEGNFCMAAIAGKKLYAFKRSGSLGEKDDNFKIASKGVRLSAKDIIRIANGESVTYVPDVPTFSVKRGIEFTPRKIVKTEN